MSLTVADYEARMSHAIGNADPATGYTLISVLDEALRELFDAHEWEWRKGGPALLSLVASTEYVALPADFGQGQLLSVVAADTLTSIVHKTSLEQIAYLRGSTTGSSLEFWVAVSWPSQTTTTASPGQARLEVWPTPTANLASALRITYRRGPVTLSGTTTQVPNIPRAFESLLSTLARAKIMAAEYGADASETLAEYALYEKQLARLISVDGAQESELGTIVNGAARDPDDDEFYLQHSNPDPRA